MSSKVSNNCSHPECRYSNCQYVGLLDYARTLDGEDSVLTPTGSREKARQIQQMYRCANQSLGYRLEYEPSIEAIELIINSDSSEVVKPPLANVRHGYIPTQLNENSPCAWADHPDAIGDPKYYCGKSPNDPIHLSDDIEGDRFVPFETQQQTPPSLVVEEDKNSVSPKPNTPPADVERSPLPAQESGFPRCLYCNQEVFQTRDGVWLHNRSGTSDQASCLLVATSIQTNGTTVTGIIEGMMSSVTRGLGTSYVKGYLDALHNLREKLSPAYLNTRVSYDASSSDDYVPCPRCNRPCLGTGGLCGTCARDAEIVRLQAEIETLKIDASKELDLIVDVVHGLFLGHVCNEPIPHPKHIRKAIESTLSSLKTTGEKGLEDGKTD